MHTHPSAVAQEALGAGLVTADYARQPIRVEVSLAGCEPHWVLLTGHVHSDRTLEVVLYAEDNPIDLVEAEPVICDLTVDGAVPQGADPAAARTSFGALDLMFAVALRPELTAPDTLTALLRNLRETTNTSYGSEAAAEQVAGLQFLEHGYTLPDRHARHVALAAWKAGADPADPNLLTATRQALL